MRIIVIEGREFTDPEPSLSTEDLRSYFANFFPDLANAETKTEKRSEDDVVTFTKKVGTKGFEPLDRVGMFSKECGKVIEFGDLPKFHQEQLRRMADDEDIPEPLRVVIKNTIDGYDVKMAGSRLAGTVENIGLWYPYGPEVHAVTYLSGPGSAEGTVAGAKHRPWPDELRSNDGQGHKASQPHKQPTGKKPRVDKGTAAGSPDKNTAAGPNAS